MAGIDSNTLLMLHLDNNSNDSSLSPYTITTHDAGGGIAFSNSIYKFGGYSSSFTHTSQNNYFIAPSGSAGAVGTASFTWDFWVYFVSSPGQVGLMGCNDGTAKNEIGINYDPTISSGVLLLFGDIGNSVTFEFSVSWIPSTATWYHIALVRKGSSGRGDWLLFINGVSQTLQWETGDGTWSIPTWSVNIGSTLNYGNDESGHTTYLDEVRISNIARWTSNFTPPTIPYSVTSPNSGMFTLIR